MLEHLDDPAGFTPDEPFRSAVVRRGRRLKRRRRMVVGAATLSVLVLAGIGGLAGLTAWRWSQVDRVVIHVADEHPTDTTTATTAAPSGDGTTPPTEAATTTVDAGTDLPAMNILVVGSDKRHGDEADIVSGQRADTLAVIAVDPIDLDARVTSIPRDLWVPIAGSDHSGRVNSALQESPAALVATIEDLLDLHIDHYVELGFEGFSDLVDMAGGVEVAFPNPARDRNTGLLVAEAGCRRLDGEMALAYVRSRHYEEFINGRWRTDPRSDLGRIARQQEFGRAAMTALGGVGSSPLDMERLTRLLADHATIDEDLDLETLRGLMGFARALESGDVTTTVVPSRPATIGGAAVLVPVEPPPGEAPGTEATATTAGAPADAASGEATPVTSVAPAGGEVVEAPPACP